jgi:C-terminal processing protease CtpA/Prc
LKLAFSPLFYGYLYFKVHRDASGQFIYNTRTAKLQPKNADAFAGKIYVLINGGSFSASCILSSNLKGAKRAFFVGQETGGAFNGTVAGQMPIVKLPHSKLKTRIGLALIAPHFKTNLDGRGIFPDHEILPTIEDKINGIDPEMNWVLEKIKLENP